MSIYCLNASVSSWDKELGVYKLLYGEDNTIPDAKPDRSPKFMGVTLRTS